MGTGWSTQENFGLNPLNSTGRLGLPARFSLRTSGIPRGYGCCLDLCVAVHRALCPPGLTRETSTPFGLFFQHGLSNLRGYSVRIELRVDDEEDDPAKLWSCF